MPNRRIVQKVFFTLICLKTAVFFSEKKRTFAIQKNKKLIP